MSKSSHAYVLLLKLTKARLQIDGRIRARLSDAHGAEYSHSFDEDHMPRVNDKRYHVIRMSVLDRNSTLSVDGVESSRQLIASSPSSSSFQRQKQQQQQQLPNDYSYNKFEQRFQSDQSVVIIEVGGPAATVNPNGNSNGGDQENDTANNSGENDNDISDALADERVFDGKIYGLVYNHFRFISGYFPN
jgi:hypothetical protein